MRGMFLENRIRQLREERGWELPDFQEAISEKSHHHISIRDLENIEHDSTASETSIGTLDRIAYAFDMSVIELLAPTTYARGSSSDIVDQQWDDTFDAMAERLWRIDGSLKALGTVMRDMMRQEAARRVRVADIVAGERQVTDRLNERVRGER